MKITHVKIGKRTFALAFTLDALAAMEAKIEDFNINDLNRYVHNSRCIVDILETLAQQGEMLEGRTLDVDRAWFGSHISPSPLNASKLQIAVLNALTDGLHMDTDVEDNGEVDVVLDEIRKKGQPDV